MWRAMLSCSRRKRGHHLSWNAGQLRVNTMLTRRLPRGSPRCSWIQRSIFSIVSRHECVSCMRSRKPMNSSCSARRCNQAKVADMSAMSRLPADGVRVSRIWPSRTQPAHLRGVLAVFGSAS